MVSRYAGRENTANAGGRDVKRSVRRPTEFRAQARRAPEVD